MILLSAIIVVKYNVGYGCKVMRNLWKKKLYVSSHVSQLSMKVVKVVGI